MVGSSRYVMSSYRPRNSLVEDISLIYRLVRYKRPPIFSVPPSVYSRLPYTTIVRARHYLNYALGGLAVGLLLAFALVAAKNLALAFFPTLLISLIIAGLYMAWLYKNDRYEPEPLWLLAFAFGMGALSTLPAVILNNIVILLFGRWMGAAAFVEEPLKMVGVYVIAVSPYLRDEFNDHLDGLIYGALAGIGFAFIENILYIAPQIARGNVLIVLARTASLIMHMFCTGLIGWWMGYLKVNGLPIDLKSIMPALLSSITVHMTWNTIAQLGILSLIDLFIFAPLLLYFVNKLAKEALIDEYYWGFAHGYAPIEK